MDYVWFDLHYSLKACNILLFLEQIRMLEETFCIDAKQLPDPHVDLKDCRVREANGMKLWSPTMIMNLIGSSVRIYKLPEYTQTATNVYK